MWRELQKFGKKCVDMGLTTSHFGNISLRVGNSILISRSGSMLDELDESTIVEVDLHTPGSFDIIASSETIVHRSIYQKTSALAIIHVHSPFATVMSMLEQSDYVEPGDTESKYFIHQIPLITGKIGSKELARNASEALKDHKVAIIRGHGSISVGKIMEEAYVHICSVEHACKVKYYYDLMRKTDGAPMPSMPLPDSVESE